MRLCKRGLNFIQIYNDYGDVRVCSWTKDGLVGNLVESSFEEIYHGEKAQKIRNRLSNGNYCNCCVDQCPWLACGKMESYMDEVTEVPKYPEWLYLAYENVCNYNCSTCDVHEKMLKIDRIEAEKRYDKIEKELEKVLPHVKLLSANGMGELFVSKRIMNILANWKPLAPAKECSVILETNGSLFDEEHWKQIENLGKYNLEVVVTVMSFDEYTYQQLSGTKLPIKQIENNLKFIKSLKEKGIVNEFRIATVVQERNFREMPTFAKRCIEEFGADYVRLRSFVPWGKKPIEDEWFTDVVNPYHPYHNEYVEIMKDPIFKNPKVHDWSGGIGTMLGEHPYKKSLSFLQSKLSIFERYVSDKDGFLDVFKKYIPSNEKIVIYGIGEVGKLLFEALKDEYSIEYIIDQYCCEKQYKEVPIHNLETIREVSDNLYVIITPISNPKAIMEKLEKSGFIGNKIFKVKDMFGL